MGTAQQAVQNGSIDSTNTFEATLQVYFTYFENGEEEERTCSGTLISPRWFITAGHCFEAPERQSANAKLRGGPLGNPNAPVVATHTYDIATVGAVKVLDPGSRGTDVTLIRLDKPVHPSVVKPVHPPVTTNGCGQNWSGTLVGYSWGGHNDYPYCGITCLWAACVPANDKVKRFSVSSPWFHESSGDGATFTHEFSGPAGDGCIWFQGGTSNDSGGSLYKTLSSGDLQLCGVISGNDYGDYTRSADLATEYIEYNTAALDVQPTLDFWRSWVLDEDGNFEGECGTPTSANDPDGDLIPSACDTCPQIYNPEQFDEVVDADGDGVDDTCDRCPGVAATQAEQIANRNSEIELARAYPDQVGPILPLRRDAFPDQQAFEDARDLYNETFKPDACDPFPVPSTEIDKGGSTPYAPYTPVQEPACAAHTGGCATSIQNKVRVTWNNTSAVPPTNTGKVGLRWCDCYDVAGADMASVSGRTACRQNQVANCQFSETLYGSSSSSWKKIYTHDTTNWPIGSYGTLGAEWFLSQTPTPTKTTYFNFLPLAGAHLSTNYAGVKGMLWAHTVLLSPTVTGLPNTEVKKFSNSLGTGNAHHTYAPVGVQWAYIDDFFWCGLDCVEDHGRPYYEVSNPDWRMSARDELRPIAAPPSSTRTFFDAVAAGTRRFIPASEPVVRMKAYAGEGTTLRGLGLSSTHQVTNVLSSTGAHDGFPAVANANYSTGAPALDGREAVVVSATLGSAFFFGGVQGTSVFRLNLETGGWQTITLPAGEGVGFVTSATYRMEDRSIYFLIRSGGALILKRMHVMRRMPVGKVQTIATFPSGSAWAAFPSVRLVTGANGDLALVAYGTGSEKTRIGRFTFNDVDQLSMVGITKSTLASQGRPLLLPKTVLTTELVSGGRSKTRSFPIASMTTPTGADLPTMSPH